MAREASGQQAGSASRRRGPVRVQDGEVEAQVNGAPRSPHATLIDLDLVRGLIAAVDTSGIDTLEIIRGGTRIKISKTPPPPPAAHVGAAAAPAAAPQATTPAAPVAALAEKPKSKLTEVTSPMVGTFYRAPAPEAPPYVEIGSQVSKGQVLCILEAMKLMNELPSEVDGVVREVLVDNADPVEYGQVLFRIEPLGS
jgi:acetyl-CoA carboxylase biotin carboxyl carrier protein